MAPVFAGMTVSLDGFVADRDGDVGRLYADFADLQGSAYMDPLSARLAPFHENGAHSTWPAIRTPAPTTTNSRWRSSW